MRGFWSLQKWGGYLKWGGGGCYCQCTKMGSNNNDIPDRLSIVDKDVQIAINKLHLLKYFNT